MNAGHLLVALSAHGFGHAAQTAAVVNALRACASGIRLTLVTTLPRRFLDSRFDGPFEVIERATDVGVLMASALEARRDDSHAAYARFHADWDERLARESEFLAALAPDLVLANVPYLPIAAARRAGIPCVALCSLNWADIYAHYFGRDSIHAQILAAYRAADLFLRLEPGMPMPELSNVRAVGPVARIGRERCAELRSRLALAASARLVLVAPGGIELRLPLERWPRATDIHFLVPASWGVTSPQATALESLGLPFTDLLRSCDAVIGKPGYGTFAEVACNGVPMLYVRRGDWPEEPCLIEWLHTHGRALEITRDTLERGELAAALARLWRTARRRPPRPAGVREAVEAIAAHLGADVPLQDRRRTRS
jgi:hypothetical protein